MDNLLKDKFLSFEGDIPMSDWFAIEEKLDKKRRFAWIGWAAVPLIIIVALSFYLTTFNKTNKLTATKPLKDIISPEKKIVTSKDFSDFSGKNNPETNPEIRSNKLSNSYRKNLVKNNVDLVVDEIPQETNASKSIFEAISIASKPITMFWNFSIPTLEKIKDLEVSKPSSKKTNLFSFEFGINLSPAMGLEAIKENKSNFINRSYFSSIAGSSSPGNGFNNGIHAQVNIGKNWYVRQGIYSTNYTVTHAYSYIITEWANVTKNIGIEYYLPRNPSEYEHIKYEGKASIKYLSLPLMVGNRAYINKRNGIESKVGVNVSKLWSAQGQVVNPTSLNLEEINSNNSIKKWNTGLSISAGWFFKPNNNLIFTVEPNFAMLLSSAKVKDYPVKTSYYNYGINLNLNYVIGGNNK
jgi:opacity protein-like surface antigen